VEAHTTKDLAVSLNLYGPEQHGGLSGYLASYADFVTVGFMHCVKRTDESVFERIVGLEPELKKLYDACGKWLERDDH
jgi:hypothetical protein